VIRCGWTGAAVAAVLASTGCIAKTEAAPADHVVTISWQANHEKGVRASGGGYEVTIGGRAPVEVAASEPTSLTTVLFTGTYTVSVRAFERDPAGTERIYSAPTTRTLEVW
jgi:hypothetical protein